jgi:hypothetical protein
MTLDRKDIRAKLDHEVHAALKAICDTEGVDMGEWIEATLVPIIEKRVHDAMVLADAFQRVGITGSRRE